MHNDGYCRSGVRCLDLIRRGRAEDAIQSTIDATARFPICSPSLLLALAGEYVELRS